MQQLAAFGQNQVKFNLPGIFLTNIHKYSETTKDLPGFTTDLPKFSHTVCLVIQKCAYSLS